MVCVSGTALQGTERLVRQLEADDVDDGGADAGSDIDSDGDGDAASVRRGVCAQRSAYACQLVSNVKDISGGWHLDYVRPGAGQSENDDDRNSDDGNVFTQFFTYGDLH